MKSNVMVVIDDLEKFEAITIRKFLTDAVENGDLPLAVQDCIEIYPEVKFHEFEPFPNASWKCKKCHRWAENEAHQTPIDEVAN